MAARGAKKLEKYAKDQGLSKQLEELRKVQQKRDAEAEEGHEHAHGEGGHSGNAHGHEHSQTMAQIVEENNKKFFLFRMISPTSPYLTTWNLLIVGIVLIVTFCVPLQIAVWWWEVPKALKGTFYFFDVMFICDMIMHFRTGIFDHHGNLVMCPHHIAHHYIHGWFCFDLVATIPWSWFIQDKGLKWIKYLKLPKLMRLAVLGRLLAAHVRFFGISGVLFVFIIVGHLGASFWILLLEPCEYGAPVETCPDVWKCYWEILASVFAMLLMNFMSPTLKKWTTSWSSAFHFWEIVFMLLGALVVGVFLAEVEILVRLRDAAGKEFAHNAHLVQKEMELLHIEEHYQVRVAAYFDYYWLNRAKFGDLRVLQDRRIPIYVRKSVAYSLYRKHLDKVSFFSVLTTREKEDVALKMTHRVYLTGDIIVHKGEETDGEMYIVSNGSVGIGVGNNEEGLTVVAILEAGSFMGEISILSNVKRTATLMALEPVELLIVTRESLNANNLLWHGSPFRKALEEFAVERMNNCKKPDEEEAGEETNNEVNEERDEEAAEAVIEQAAHGHVQFRNDNSVIEGDGPDKSTKDDSGLLEAPPAIPSSASKQSIGNRMLSMERKMVDGTNKAGKKIGGALMKSMHASKLVKKKPQMKAQGGPLSLGLMGKGSDFTVDAISADAEGIGEASEIPTDLGSLYNMVSGDLNKIRADLRVFIQGELARVARAAGGPPGRPLSIGSSSGREATTE